MDVYFVIQTCRRLSISSNPHLFFSKLFASLRVVSDFPKVRRSVVRATRKEVVGIDEVEEGGLGIRLERKYAKSCDDFSLLHLAK